ncbi:MAG: carbohydrate kinase family protein [Nanoarchaeota archaeon]
MYDIITLGSANIDIFVKTKQRPEIRKHFQHTDIAYHLGDKLIIEDLEITTGGGGTNTAVAFSRLGLKTGCICVLGKDPNGQYVLNELKKEKVIFLGKIKEGNTGLSIVLPGAKDRTILAYKGVNNFLQINDINLQKINAKWFYVSSMLGQSLETSEKIIHLAKKKGSKIALNLSLYLAKLGLDRLANVLSIADAIILNREEAQVLTGKKKIHDIFHSMYNYTNAIVAITSGSGYIYASDSIKIYTKKVNPVNPVDKTGAGDAFASGFLFGIMKSANVHYALECGHEEALSVLGHIGAKNNLLRKL